MKGLSGDHEAGIAQSIQWLGCELDCWEMLVQFLAVARDFFISRALRQALGPMQPPSQWIVPSHFPWGLSSQGMKLTTHFHVVLRFRNEWNYIFTLNSVFVVYAKAKISCEQHCDTLCWSQEAHLKPQGSPCFWSASTVWCLMVTPEIHLTWPALAFPLEKMASQRLGLLGLALPEKVTCPWGMEFFFMNRSSRAVLWPPHENTKWEFRWKVMQVAPYCCDVKGTCAD